MLKTKIRCFIAFLVVGLSPIKAQSLEHPIIWATQGDRADILQTIEDYDWAQTIVTKLHSNVDALVLTHQTNPSSILATIPELAESDDLSEAESTTHDDHARVLSYASHASLLYYLTEDEKYAQFAADILYNYIEDIAEKTPETTSMCGNDFYDPRTGYPHFAIAYDFIYDFLRNDDTQVYSLISGTNVDVDITKTEKAVHNVAMNALHEHGGTDNKYGNMVSNHPILRAPGVLFNILCVADDTERERMFKVFWETGTKEQNSFTKTILPMFGEQGIWPEALSYSFMPNVTLVLNIVDRLKPDLNVMDDKMTILDGNFMFDNLRLPNRRFVRYGDSHRDNDGTGKLYRYTLNLATRRNYTSCVQKAKVALRQAYDEVGGYDPSVSISTFDSFGPFEQLLWGVDIPDEIDGEINFQKPTVIVKHAGVALQRNYVEENNVDYGLCGIIGGAHYVHSHCTGITMELYGADYVMAANAGLPHTVAQRKLVEHTDYFWRHAGNNTMIVNGTTHGIQTGAWNSNSDLWMNTTVNVAAEPKHLEDPISDNFSFATQFLDDEVNNDQQQRTLSIIRTSATSGYYFDMFRSKSLGTNNFHDYVYHNIGDETHFFNSDNEELSVSATTRYQNDIGDTHESPGWRFFEETKTTASIDSAVHVRFDLNETNTYMNMFVAAGMERAYTRALGPGTREAKGGYEDKQTQIIAIRQQGEAWNKPYVHIFEPSTSTNTSVQSVEHLYRGNVIVGAKVTSQIGAKSVVDYVICQEDASQVFSLPSEELSFTGRFAVVRKEQDNTEAQLTLYIGEGDSLSYGEYTLKANADKKGVLEQSIEADLSRVLGFKDLVDGQEIEKGANLTIESFVGTDFTEVSLWLNDTVNIGTLTEAPYVWASHPLLTDMNDLYYDFKMIAKDAQGEEEIRSIMLRTPGQWAYTADGKPHPIPGMVQFEYYDNGGIDVAYWDKINQNSSSFRPDEMVDINTGGTVVRDIKSGEWLEFTIDVSQLAYYGVDVKHQTRRSPAFEQLTVSLPDEKITLLSDIVLTNTGSGNYATENIGEVLLEAGVHVLRFGMLNYGFDLDNFELTKVADVFTVSFNDGSSTKELYTTSDSTCNFPPRPTKDDSVFVLWHTKAGDLVDAETIISEDVELFASWAVKTYTLQTSANEGQIDISPQQESYDLGAEVTLTATPTSGYEFTGWSGDYTGTENPLLLNMTKDMLITALFEPETTGINDATIESLSLSPNPCNGKFMLTLGGCSEGSYKLYTLSGIELLSGQFVTEVEIALADYKAGIYLVEVTTDKGRCIQRVIFK